MDAAISAMGLEATTGGHGIPIGTPVHDVWGEKIGSVADADPYELIVERGFILVHDYPVKLSDVDRYEDGKLYLRLTKEAVLDQHPGGGDSRS